MRGYRYFTGFTYLFDLCQKEAQPCHSSPSSSSISVNYHNLSSRFLLNAYICSQLWMSRLYCLRIVVLICCLRILAPLAHMELPYYLRILAMDLLYCVWIFSVAYRSSLLIFLCPTDLLYCLWIFLLTVNLLYLYQWLLCVIIYM